MPQLYRTHESNDMSFTEHRFETVCFTGHRTEKFLDQPLYSNDITLNIVKTLLTLLTADAYDRGARYFITGMARGVDLWAGELLLYMKRFLSDVHIIAAMPHMEQGRGFAGQDAEIFISLGNAADAVIFVGEKPSKWCYHSRNDYMLRHSSAVLGVIHEDGGGTAYTLRNAVRNCTQRRIIDIEDYMCLIPLLDRYPEIGRMNMPSQRYAFWEKYPDLLYQCGLFSED